MSLKVVYCSNCGLKLPITRKALPSHSAIIDLVDQHVCSEEPVPFDLKPCKATPYVKEDNRKFKAQLDELNPSNSEPVIFQDKVFHDSRPSDVVRSMAPQSVLDRIKGKVGS